MENKILKIGIVGLGNISRCCHIPAYLRMDNVKIMAVCDANPDKYDMLKNFLHEAYNSDMLDDVEFYTDYNDLIAKADIDAVDICTPNYLHSPIAVAALNAGKHVFCEKPDSVSVEDVLKMKEASERNNKVLMVMRNNRHEPHSKIFKELADKGEFGKIYCGRCGWIRRRGVPGRGGWFTTKAMSGGGPLIDLGVHMIDLAIYLMGNPTPVAVSGSVYQNFADNDAKATSEHAAFGEAKADGTFDVEDQAMGFIKFDNGACLQLDFSWAGNQDDNDFNFVELRGSKAGLKWAFSGGRAVLFKEVDGEQVDIPIETDCKIGGHEGNLRHFADVVLNGAEPDFLPIQGVNMIKILSAIYESAETGREVSLID